MFRLLGPHSFSHSSSNSAQKQPKAAFKGQDSAVSSNMDTVVFKSALDLPDPFSVQQFLEEQTLLDFKTHLNQTVPCMLFFFRLPTVHMGIHKIHKEDTFTTGPRIAVLPPELCRAPLHLLYAHTRQHRTWNGHRFWSRSSRMVNSKNYTLRRTGSQPRVHCEGPAWRSSHQCLTRMLLDQQSELV